MNEREDDLFGWTSRLLLCCKILERCETMQQRDYYELNGDTMIIHLPEELDHHTAKMIREETDQLFCSKRIRNVVFDYENTHFMDSSGIGLVMGRYREVRYLNGDIYITCVNRKVARILEISGLYRVAKKADAIDDALELIGGKHVCLQE